MTDNTLPLAIGQSSATAFFNAVIDEVALYSIAVTPTQISNRAGIPPVNTSLPTVAGTPKIGATLTSTTGTWPGLVTGYTSHWQRCTSTGDGCTSIPGE